MFHKSLGLTTGLTPAAQMDRLLTAVNSLTYYRQRSLATTFMKLNEEVGELAASLLMDVNEKKRPAGGDDTLSEAVDVLLCVMSMVVKLASIDDNGESSQDAKHKLHSEGIAEYRTADEVMKRLQPVLDRKLMKWTNDVAENHFRKIMTAVGTNKIINEKNDAFCISVDLLQVKIPYYMKPGKDTVNLSLSDVMGVKYDDDEITLLSCSGVLPGSSTMILHFPNLKRFLDSLSDAEVVFRNGSTRLLDIMDSTIKVLYVPEQLENITGIQRIVQEIILEQYTKHSCYAAKANEYCAKC